MTFNQNLESISKARSSNVSVTSELYKAKINVLKQSPVLTATELSAKLALQQQAEKASKETLQQSVKDLYTDNSPQTLITNWDSKVPVLLMPLRLETRFMEVEGRQELWLRIYPDDISVQQHEPLLSEKELQESKKYWMAFFEAEKSEADAENFKKSAWEQLKKFYAANRSAWIAKQTAPVNWSNRTALAKKEELVFPDMPLLKTEEWTQAPKTQVLPDKFVVSIFKSDAKVYEQTGNLVPVTLFLGHDPFQGGDAFTKTDFGIEFAKEFSWMSNFEEAVNVGMGMKIELKNEFYSDPSKRLIDRIAVLGVYLSADPVQSQELLGNLLESHRYTEGLAIIPQGTPTNNTEDNSSGFVPNEDPQPKGYYEIPTIPPFQNDSLCDGNRLASALGIEASVIEGISHDTCRDHAEAVIMNSALFPATIGYYFDTLLDKYVDDKYLPLLQTFFENNVTGAGPLPSIRVGDQPYGILVTSDFPNWVPMALEVDQFNLYAQIEKVLKFFSSQWEIQSKKVLYIGRDRDENNNQLNPDDVFLDVVGLEPASVSFERRTGYLNDLPLLQTTSPNFQKIKLETSSNEALIQNQLVSFGGAAPVSPLLFTNLIFRQENKVYIPEKNLIDGLPDSETRLLPNIAQINKNYLAWLADISALEMLEKQDFSGANAPNYLLYLLARHALLLELRRSALEILNKKESTISRSAFDKTYFNLGGSTTATRDLTIWEVLYADLSKIDTPSPDPAIHTIGDKLLKQSSGNIKSLKSLFASLSVLPTARLERLLTGHLDCLTYRLDAWQSGLFNERLESLRKDAITPVKGIYLGAFGYLENLMPAPQAILDTPELPQSLQPPNGEQVYGIADNAGLLHAPSLDHAAAAALLMAGYRNHATPQDPGVFSVNLSTARIRKATQILEGVRNGQSVEALLGYQFERACHERTLEGNNLNQFILAFRKNYPIENQYNKQEGEAGNPDIFRPVQPDVVNGLKITKEKTAGIFASIIKSIIPPSSIEFSKFVNLLLEEADRLSDTLDAIKDLLLSESVFQAASGNTARTGAVLEALREGSVPPDPGILKTPRRSRFALNHLISLHFPQTTPDLNPWGINIPLSPRSQFEPGLNLWLSKIFGNPANIVCTASHIIESTSSPAPPKNISLADLKIQPVDFLIYSGKDVGSGATELERRISHQYRVLANLPSQQKVDIDFAGKIIKSRKSFAEILPLAKSLHSVLSQARAVHAQDYSPFVQGQLVNTINPNGYEITELQNRTKDAIDSLEKAIEKLDNVIPNNNPKNEANPATLNLLFKQWEAQNFSESLFVNFPVSTEKIEEIIQLRIDMSSFDIPGAWPVTIPNKISESQAAFLADTAQVWRGVHLQLENAKSVLNTISETENIEEQAGLLSKLAKLLLGPNFPVMPKFKYQNANDIRLAFKDRKQILKYYSTFSGLHDAIIPDDWFQSVSGVRSNAGKWDFARSLAEIHGNADLLLIPIQLPYRKTDSWLAVQFPATDPVTGQPFGVSTDTISCAIFGQDAVNTDSLQSGLLIDEWSETIPVESETSGIAFNYNQPDSMPPQALLLAIYPGIENNWTWDALLGTVMDTFRRAKMRAVEPKHFDQNQVIHHFLPGIIAPVNIKVNNITLDFAVASDEFLKRLPRGIELYDPHLKATIQ